MIPLTRCRVCGYVTAESKLGDKCPACGAPRTAFEPYVDRVSERRRRLLDLHLHPMIVHFPQAFSVSLLLLSFAPLLFTGKARDMLVDALMILALALPAAAALAFLAGLVDGRVRFRQIGRSPILRRKVALGLILFLASLGEALLIWRRGVSGLVIVPVIVLAVIAFGASFILGLLGNSITGSEMPGD